MAFLWAISGKSGPDRSFSVPLLLLMDGCDMNVPMIPAERTAEFFSLLGLLLTAVALFSSKHFDLPFGYVSFGIICSFYGFGLYIYQLPTRRVYRGPRRSLASAK